MRRNLDEDIAAVARIDVVPTILEVVCRTTGMGFAAVARVTEEKWIACAVRDEIAFGLVPGSELKIETTICNEIRASGKGVIIDHVAESGAFRNHHTPAMYGFQSYISLPIVLKDETFFGTLCAIDPRPAQVSRPEVVHMFKLFAQLIAFHIDAQEKVAASEAALLGERQIAELREQFLAVLGHDLRNPLAGIDAGVRMLKKEAVSGRGPLLLDMVENSVRRMSELIDNMLDLARGRLGGGMSITRVADASLTKALEQVVQELREARPDRIIEAAFDLNTPIPCERARIAQLLSNLLANALTHGAPDQPVRVSGLVQGGVFELSVTNEGAPIPPATLKRLFQPFFRGATPTQGLGLGLYISGEIARSHGGTIDAASTAEETRFTFRMPVS